MSMIFHILTGSVAAAALIALAVTAILQHKRLRSLRREVAETQARADEIGSFLARFSSGMQGSDGVSGAMHGAARYVAEQCGAESVAIYETRDDELTVIGVYGPYPFSDPALPPPSERELPALLAARHIPVGEGFVGEIARHRVAELIPAADKDLRFAPWKGRRVTSVMAAPMNRDGFAAGVVVAVNSRSGHGKALIPAQFERLKLLSHQVMLVNNLRLAYGEISKRERIDQELGFALRLQQSLLPHSYPEWGSFSILASTRSVKEVNGDFYDFIQIDDDRLLVILGDAAGKGVPACLLSAMARSFARAMTDNFTTLPDFLHALNSKLRRDSGADRFVTLGCCLLDRKHSLLEFGRAGHTELICFIHGHLRTLSPDGTMLGMLPAELAAFETICVSLEPGTRTLMYSDGLSEALDDSGVEFGAERLAATFAEAGADGAEPAEIVERITGAVRAYEREQSDDQTVVLIARKAAAPAESAKESSGTEARSE